MSPEGYKPSEIRSALTTTAIIGGILLLSECAFSKSSAKKIGQRAGWKSEISGKSFWEGWMLHMAHILHTKDETYDDPSRGICVTVEEHLQMHEKAKGHARDIGLTESGNNYAIKKLKETPIYNKYKK